MSFGETFKSGAFCLDLKSETKEGIITEMVDAMLNDGIISDRDEVIQALLERESKESTGMQHGIAVPHGKAASVESLAVAFGIKRGGIDFGAIDGKPSFIFIMTVSSVLQVGPHMRYLAEISRILSKPAARSALLNAESRKEIIDIVCPDDA